MKRNLRPLHPLKTDDGEYYDADSHIDVVEFRIRMLMRKCGPTDKGDTDDTRLRRTLV